MTLVKNYPQADFHVDSLRWTGCHDASPLAYHPDSANGGDTCLSADYQSWSAWVNGETTKQLHVRVRLPTTGIETFFAASSATTRCTRSSNYGEIHDETTTSTATSTATSYDNDGLTG